MANKRRALQRHRKLTASQSTCTSLDQRPAKRILNSECNKLVKIPHGINEQHGHSCIYSGAWSKNFKSDANSAETGTSRTDERKWYFRGILPDLNTKFDNTVCWAHNIFHDVLRFFNVLYTYFLICLTINNLRF